MKKRQNSRMSFVVPDYLRDTRCLSLAARGAWMDILCTLWQAKPRGSKTLTLVSWAGEIGKPVLEVEPILAELRDHRVAEFIDRQGLITIASRRMIREREQNGHGIDGQELFLEQTTVSLIKKPPTQDLPKTNRERLEVFTITPELKAWAMQEGILRPEQYIDEFKDYWRGVIDQKLKENWPATYRNNLRRLKEQGKLRQPSQIRTLCTRHVKKKADSRLLEPCGNPTAPGQKACPACLTDIARLTRQPQQEARA